LRSSRENLGGPSAPLADDAGPWYTCPLCGFIYKIIINYSVAYYDYYYLASACEFVFTVCRYLKRSYNKIFFLCCARSPIFSQRRNFSRSIFGCRHILGNSGTSRFQLVFTFLTALVRPPPCRQIIIISNCPTSASEVSSSNKL